MPTKPTRSKDMTAELMQTAVRMALQARLRHYVGIDVEVWCTGAGLMAGKFGGMDVRGQRWSTPLDLTAERLEVQVGEMVVDYAALLWQQKVQLRNVPAGRCAITLQARDLGNFMVHPLMRGPAAKAVQGKAFHFDRASVRMGTDAEGRGYVQYDGTWAGDNRCHRVVMTPDARATAAVPLMVSAVPLPPALAPACTSLASGGSQDAGDDVLGPAAAATAAAAAASGSVTAQSPVDPGAGIVASELAHFFTNLQINLQGIELRKPALVVHLPVSGAGSHGVARAAPAVAMGNGLLLEISMQLRILDLPPLNMKF